MGMFYCDKCKAERTVQGACPFCGTTTRKYWWSFPKGFDGKHPNAPHGYKVYYDETGNPGREEEY